MLAGVGFEEAHEYAIALFLLIASAILLSFSAFHWTGIKDFPRFTKVTRIIIFAIGLGLWPVSFVWILNAKMDNPWTRLIKPSTISSTTSVTTASLFPSTIPTTVIQQQPTGEKIAKEIEPEIKRQGDKKSKEVVSAKDTYSQEVPSLKKLFAEDFPTFMHSDAERKIGIKTGASESFIMILEKEYENFEAKSKFLGYYIPLSPHSYEICEYLPDLYKETMRDFGMHETQVGRVTELTMTSSKDLVFSGRVYVYHEYNFSLQQLASLERLYESKGLSVLFRGPSYLNMMWDQKFKTSEHEQKSK